MSATTPYKAPPNGWRTFLIVWVTQSVSVIGTALTGFAITIWLTTGLYPAPAQSRTGMGAVCVQPWPSPSPYLWRAGRAGAFVDRHDRKRTMIAIDFLNGCLSTVGTML